MFTLEIPRDFDTSASLPCGAGVERRQLAAEVAVLDFLGVGVRRAGGALALPRQDAAGGAACVRDRRDAGGAPRVVVPEVVGRATFGVSIDGAQALLADRGLARGELEGGGAHRAAVEARDVVRVRHDVLAGEGVDPDYLSLFRLDLLLESIGTRSYFALRETLFDSFYHSTEIVDALEILRGALLHVACQAFHKV